MIILETELPGAFVIEPEPHLDERGSFFRIFCRDELRRHGLRTEVVQCSMSSNRRRGTLRGMHLQLHPAEETRLVRCTRGAVYDVMVDLRPESSAFRRWVAYELDPVNGRGVYVPAGVAHGFITLRDGTDLLYQMTVAYEPSCAAGVRWNDPAFGIRWPVAPVVISERDRSYPDFDAARVAAAAFR